MASTSQLRHFTQKAARNHAADIPAREAIYVREGGPGIAPMDVVGARILILEDDTVLRRQLGRLFAARGCDVMETACVASFVDAARTCAYDGCLLDLWLPDGNGLDAWEQVRPTQKRARAVVMSGEPTAEAHARARSLGCWDLLAKPFDLATLLVAYAPLLLRAT